MLQLTPVPDDLVSVTAQSAQPVIPLQRVVVADLDVDDQSVLLVVVLHCWFFLVRCC